jgi:hypothetical protein
MIWAVLAVAVLAIMVVVLFSVWDAQERKENEYRELTIDSVVATNARSISNGLIGGTSTPLPAP